MTIKYYNVPIEVTYKHYIGEPETHDYPGSPDEVELLSAEVNDIDITEILVEEQIEDIEDLILKEI
tara:strand:+ start:572 stop:769 length:198 start_codon:yes stop_codon:yes gene_type:complete